jgi:hypothetical protein
MGDKPTTHVARFGVVLSRAVLMAAAWEAMESRRGWSQSTRWPRAVALVAVGVGGTLISAVVLGNYLEGRPPTQWPFLVAEDAI